jgi:transcriptional regulator with PAS, ATPase and Fis domain
MMMDYHWPGNVRELKNVIERAIILESEEMILPEHLPPEIISPEESLHGDEDAIKLPKKGVSLNDVEKDLIKQALETARGNQVRAAKLLGLSRDTLRYRMKKYGLL